MQVRTATGADVERWASMRSALWPDGDLDEHRAEVLEQLDSSAADKIAFIAVDDEGAACGFAEASLRRDYVNGCDTSPVGFLEGVFIEPTHQGRGVGRRLCSAAEKWAREKECRELASDALLENIRSHAFHAAVGFEETERVVYFRKNL
jgi:aminoglycoside 6'-N-acetyltransferase I